jgi:tRNA (adenine58-N1)-methyltransferase non-catalytic subunit
MSEENRIVTDGSDVIIVFNESQYVFAQAKQGKHLNLKKGVRLALGELVGREYGAYYDVSGAQLRALSVAELNDVFQLFGVDRNDAADMPDNRDMRQDGSAQTLDADTIAQLKHGGAQGREIVGELVGNSKTFATRTVFSQQKYLAKKKRKYFPTIQLLRPTARTIARAFYATEPKSIAYLRADTLASLLCGANVMADSVVAVVGDPSGLLLGAALERLNADARVLYLHCKGNKLSFDALNYFGRNLRKRVDVRPLGSTEAREWCEARGGATSLLIAGNFDPRETLFAALPLLLPSSNFAVHCRFAEPLSDCYWRLRRGAMACNIQLSSSFVRTLQVLPNRTHPMMEMDGGSGFVLTGINVSGGVDIEVVNDELDRKRAAEAMQTAATTAAAASAASVVPLAVDDSIEHAAKRTRTEEPAEPSET